MKKSLLVFFTILTAIALGQTKFQHISNPSKSNSNSTFLDAAGLNNNPNAIIIIEADANARASNPHPIGVWYDGSKWAVFNQDKAAMPAGVTFNITWKNADANTFYQRSSSANLSNGRMVIDNAALNNHPAAAFYVSQVWNPGGGNGLYNNAEITVEYNKSLAKWAVKNINGSSIPDGAAFNVLVVTNNNAGNTIINPAIINNLPPVVNNPGTVINTIPANNNNPVINLANAQAFTNTDFEFGLSKWTATGTAFNNQPVQGNTVTSERVLLRMKYDNGGIGGDYWKGMAYPIGIKNDFWIGTYEKGNGDAPTGTLTSSPIKITNRYLHFLLGGGNDINKLYVELQVKKTDYEAAWGAGRRSVWGETADGFVRVSRVTSLLNTEELYRYWFDLDVELNHQFANKTIRIEIVDNSSRGWGHINTDDFQQSDLLTDFISINKDGFSLYADKNKPVFGFADTHAHWVNNVGLNGLMHGSSGGNWQTSDVRRDIPPCDGFNHDLPAITPGLLIAITENKAFNRIPERLADPGNALCIASVIATGILWLPSGVAIVGGVGAGAMFGALGQAASGAQASTGALDGVITGAVWGLVTNPAFQGCGYQFTKDVIARHYGNYTPADRPEISNYVDFPRWNSFAHQMMHVSWVKRSYDGGQRLMVVPVGTAKSWEFNTTPDGTMGSAKGHIENAIAALKKLVSLNSDWLQIAYTPKQARETILSNKMAVVIALEQAEVGSFFNSVEEEIHWLDTIGIRHVFPIHNINNTLGGAAVFNSALNSYNDLVNRRSNDGPITAFHVEEGNSNDETRVSVKLNRQFMRQNLRTIPIAGFGTIPFFYINDVPAEYNYESFTYHKNADGLTLKGREYIIALMKKGMIIDVDHMSDKSQNDAMALLTRNNYPMISGHTNLRDLRRDENETGGDKEPRLKTEFTIYNSRADEINNAGGMFGLMNQQNNIRTANGCPVPNNSAGGSSSFAQAYWYILQKTGGEKGIAFGSDFNGFAPQVSPRFGTDAAYFLEGDAKLNIKTGNKDEETLRRNYAFAQTKGVRYDVSVKTYHYHRFLKPSFLTSEEREIWEAIAIAKSGTQPAAAWQPGGGFSVERTGLQQDKIHNLAEGFAVKPIGDFLRFINCPEYLLGEPVNDCLPERKAAFMAANGEGSIPQEMKTPRTMELYHVIKPIYDLWMQFESGPNEPLRRSFAYPGGRDFDFNLDGLAHYGMYPDFIQDLKNSGLNSEQIKPLFLAAEQYIKMWEQADVAKNTIHN